MKGAKASTIEKDVDGCGPPAQSAVCVCLLEHEALVPHLPTTKGAAISLNIFTVVTT